MNKLLKIALPIVALVVAVAVSVVLFMTRPEVEHQQVRMQAPLVTVTPAQSKSMHIPVFTRGTVSPGTQIQLVSEVSGQVIEVSPDFANGGFFHKGEVLYRVDPIEYEVNIKRAEAQQAQAYQAYLQAKAEREARARSSSRNKNKLATFEVQFRQAEAQYLAAKAELEAVNLQKERTIVRAPFDGRVMMAGLNVGQYLRPGIQVGVIYAVDIAEVRLPLSDRQLSLVDVPARLTPEERAALPKVIFSEQYAGKTFTWQGQIVRAEGGVDERNRLLYVVAQVPNPYGEDPNQPGRPELVSGSFVEAKIAGRQFDRVFAIPRKALRNGSQIWIVGDDGRLTKRNIGILYKSKDTIFVSTGVDDGDQVVLSQLDIAVEGMRVRTKAEENIQDLQEVNKTENPFADNQPVDSALSDAIHAGSKGVTMKVDAQQARALASKAKDVVDNMSDDQKTKLTQTAKNLASQIEALQSSMKQAAAERQAKAKPAPQPSAPAAQAEPAAAKQETPSVVRSSDTKMSPLADQLEQDMARQQAKAPAAAAQPKPNVAAATPAPTPTPTPAEPTQKKSQEFLADSGKGSSSSTIATVTAPKPLSEASQ